MTNTVVNFDSDQTISNPLKSATGVNTLITTALATHGAFPFSNSTTYVKENIVYYLGINYIAPVNIAAAGGTPLTNTTWRQIPTWGSYTTTASAAGTFVMDLYSSEIQRISGTTTHIYTLPVVTTLPALGKPFYFINDSTGTVTVNSSGGNLVATILAGQRYLINCILLTGTTAASWVTDSGQETTSTIGALILSATTKATPVDADILALSDSAASNILKGLTWANLKATLLTTWKDATGGLVGLTLFKINFKNAANTFTSFFTNANTAARTYTFQDKDGTIADSADVALKATDSLTVHLAGTESITGVKTITDGSLKLAGATSGASTLKAPAIASTYVHTLPARTGTIADDTDLALKAPIANASLTGTLDVNGTGGGLGQVDIVSDGGVINNLSLMDSRANAANNGGTLNFGGIYTGASYAQWASIIGIKLNGNDGDNAGGLRFNTRSVADGFTNVLDITSAKVVDLKIGQLKFPATANPSADANTLDDYEEGTWTPGVAFGGGSIGVTYSAQVGLYTKIGRKVTWTANIVLTSNGSSTGAFSVTGLPFATNSTANAFASAVIGETAGITYVGEKSAYLLTSTTICNLEQVTELGVTTAITELNVSDSAQLIISGYYFV